VRPALAETERAFAVAVGRINIDDMAKRGIAEIARNPGRA
jgi:hypothetical protein